MKKFKPNPKRNLFILVEAIRNHILPEMKRDTHEEELLRTSLDACTSRAEMLGLSEYMRDKLYKKRAKPRKAAKS
jgi:hypothetical protein